MIFVHVAPATDVIPVNGGFGMVGVMPTMPHAPIPTTAPRSRTPSRSPSSMACSRAASCSLVTIDEIVACADSQDVDLIVIGSRGHGALATVPLGSVSRGVLSESKRPVAIVRGLAAVPVGAS